jgi:hypothetical protein
MPTVKRLVGVDRQVGGKTRFVIRLPYTLAFTVGQLDDAKLKLKKGAGRATWLLRSFR